MIRGLGWANTITIARIVLIPVFLVVMLGQWPYWGPILAAVLFVVLALTDAVDGYVARTRGEITKFGKLMDPLADKLLVSAALIALVDLGLVHSWIAILIIAREFIVSGLRMVAVAEGKVIEASGYGKTKTVLQIIAIVMFTIRFAGPLKQLLGATGMVYFGYLSWVMMGAALVMTVVSAIDYFIGAGRVLAGPWTVEPTE